MWVPQEELLRAPAASFTGSIPTVFRSQKGTHLPGLGDLVWVWDSTPEISFPNFYPRGCGASLFCVRALPTSLDACGFFNSIVVRLLFNSISDFPE